MNPIDLSIFANRVEAVCDEMGAVLKRAAFSPNIKDRLDYSCALFDDQGALIAQAAHIPVHLGSMAYAMADLVNAVSWAPGDMVIVNDPYLGGTHLPDVTLIAPVFIDERLSGFVANRAHHANIGAESPGSMPISHTLEQEGLVIPPEKLLSCGKLNEELFSTLMERTGNNGQMQGDLQAQISANRAGIERAGKLIRDFGPGVYADFVTALHDYAERLAFSCIEDIPDGDYTFKDVMDDDGMGNQAIPIQVKISIGGRHVAVDFSGTAPQVRGNINCPLSVAAAGVFYVFRCLMPRQTPACWGAFRSIAINAPLGCLVNAQYPHAVAAGNVETSTRIVDVVLGALAQAIPDRIPAASHGSMNNVAMGARDQEGGWDYYETIGGGMGGSSVSHGLHAVQTHMTNTRNTPIEVLESNYPLRVRQYRIRYDSGGRGLHNGGNGIVREYEFLAPAHVTLLTERRHFSPWGLNGGEAGKAGVNRKNDRELPPKCEIEMQGGDRLTIETPGGGGWGKS